MTVSKLPGNQTFISFVLWFIQNLPESTLVLFLLGLTWTHLNLLGLTGTHLYLLGLTWTHLYLLGLTRTHLWPLWTSHFSKLWWSHQEVEASGWGMWCARKLERFSFDVACVYFFGNHRTPKPQCQQTRGSLVCSYSHQKAAVYISVRVCPVVTATSPETWGVLRWWQAGSSQGTGFLLITPQRAPTTPGNATNRNCLFFAIIASQQRWKQPLYRCNWFRFVPGYESCGSE